MIARLIDIYEWRVTATILALGMLGIVLPLSFLFRHKPEQYGYSSDGIVKDTTVLDNGLTGLQAVEVDIRAKKAIKSSTFWHIAVAYLCHAVLLGAVATHVMPYLSSVGIARSMSSLVATGIPLMSIGGRLGLGWLGDRTNRRLVVAGAFAMMGLGLFCFDYASIQGSWLLVPFLVTFGFGYGGCIALRAALVREYFGRTNFGTIFGVVVGMGMLGQAIGAPITGWVYDNWGSYQNVWFVFVAVAIIALISVLTIRPVRNASEVADKDLP